MYLAGEGVLSPSGQVVDYRGIALNLHSDYKEANKANESKGKREATQMLSMLATQRTTSGMLTTEFSGARLFARPLELRLGECLDRLRRGTRGARRNR